MKRVLIVEDQKEIREILDIVFRKELGFTHITFACDGLEGYAEAYLQKFDLICTDHCMPYCKGADMVMAIRNKSGLNQHTPILMVSSYASEIADKMNNLESTYMVEKPIDFNRLTRYVKMALLNQSKKDQMTEV